MSDEAHALTDEEFIQMWNEAPTLARFCEKSKYSTQQATSKASQLRAMIKRIVVPHPKGELDDKGMIKMVPKYPNPALVLKKFSPSGRKGKDIEALIKIGQASLARAEAAVPKADAA